MAVCQYEMSGMCWARRGEASLGCAPGEAALGCSPGLGDRKGVPRWLVHIAGEANQTVGIGTANSGCSEGCLDMEVSQMGAVAAGRTAGFPQGPNSIIWTIEL